MAARKTGRGWIFGLIVAIPIALVYAFHQNTAQNKVESPDDPAVIAAKAVTVLPPGTEDAWFAYIDRRVAALMHREGAAVKVVGVLDKLMGGTVIVSANSAYRINCDMLGDSVQFGYGDDATVVQISGFMALPPGEKPPPLGVRPDSIAATDLRAKVCERISQRVQEIMHTP